VVVDCGFDGVVTDQTRYRVVHVGQRQLGRARRDVSNAVDGKPVVG
jgi:hypothetical protein